MTESDLKENMTVLVLNPLNSHFGGFRLLLSKSVVDPIKSSASHFFTVQQVFHA